MAEPFSMSAIWLTVRDLPRSVAFYRETLGLPLAEEVPGMAQFDLGTVRLWLRPAEDGANDGSFAPQATLRPNPLRRVSWPQAHRRGFNRPPTLVLSVHAGIEQRCRELEARGVIFSASLAATPLGRMASFPDPDGHLLSLWEPAPGTPALAVPRSAGAARRSEEVLTLLSRAEDAKLLDDYAQAARYYRLIVEAEPEHLAAWGSLSYVLNQQGAYAESLEAGERALALEPELPEVWNNRGNALGALGRPAEALAAFEQATKLAPATVEFIINKALALLNLSRREEALATIDLALALDDGQPVAWSNRGWILAQLGRYQEALDSVEQALGLGLQAAGAMDTKGYALAGLGRYEEAITCYDRALAQAPHDAEILAHRAAALRP